MSSFTARCLSAAALSTISVLNFAFAAQAQAADVKQQRIQAQNRAMDPFEKVAQPPRELPYMAQVVPGDAKFIYGMRPKKSDNGGSSLVLRYSARESGPDIMKFYAASLKQSGWTIDGATQQVMTASYKGNQCTVQLTAASTPGYAVDFQLNYKMRNQ